MSLESLSQGFFYYKGRPSVLKIATFLYKGRPHHWETEHFLELLLHIFFYDVAKVRFKTALSVIYNFQEKLICCELVWKKCIFFTHIIQTFFWYCRISAQNLSSSINNLSNRHWSAAICPKNQYRLTIYLSCIELLPATVKNWRVLKESTVGTS